MVITRAMGRHLRSYPHARFPDHEDLLKRPLLDDHLSRQGNSEAYPRGGVCDSCIVFIDICLVMFIGVLRLILIKAIHSYMLFNSYKVCGKINLQLLQRRGSTSPKLNQDPI